MKVILLVLMYCTVTFSQSQIDDSKGEDGKAATPIDNAFSDQKTVANIIKGVGAGVGVATELPGAIDKAKQLKGSGNLNAGGILKSGVSSGANSLKGAWFKYQTNKTTIIQSMGSVIDKMSALMEIAEDKINEWETTLPMVEAFGQQAVRAFDNTKKTWRERKWSDMWDIDRKWDRKWENVLMHDYDLGRSAVGWLTRRYYAANTPLFATRTVGGFRQALTSTDDEKRELYAQEGITSLLAFDKVAEETDIWRKVPQMAMMSASEALLLTSNIMTYSRVPVDRTHNTDHPDNQTDEQRGMGFIEAQLAIENRTMIDEYDITEGLHAQRKLVEGQEAELEQITAHMSALYSRLQLRKSERPRLESETYKASVVRLMGKGEVQSFADYIGAQLKTPE